MGAAPGEIKTRLDGYLAKVRPHLAGRNIRNTADFCGGNGRYGVMLSKAFNNILVDVVDYKRANFEIRSRISWISPTEFYGKANLKKYDLIFFRHGLEHMTPKEASVTVHSLKNSLSAGGVLCVIVPNEYEQGSSMRGHAPHTVFYSYKSLSRLLNKNGWDILSSGFFGPSCSITEKYVKPISRLQRAPRLIRGFYLTIAGLYKIACSYLVRQDNVVAAEYSSTGGGEILFVVKEGRK